MNKMQVDDTQIALCQNIYGDVMSRLPEVVSQPSRSGPGGERMVGGLLDAAILATLPSVIHSAVNIAVGLVQKPVIEWEASHAAQIRQFLGDQVIAFLKATASGLPSAT